MVRTNFLGCAILALLLPVYFVVYISFESVPYVAGVLFPLSALAISCFLNKAHTISSHNEIIKNKWAWLCVFVFLIVGGALQLVTGVDYGTSWYIAAAIFFLLTNAGQLVLALFGLRSYSNPDDVIK
jgi:hypothetical protein